MIRLSRKAFIFFSLILLITFKASAQETVSDFLLTAFEDRSLETYDSQTAFLKPKNFRIPIIDEIELRAGNDEQTYEDLQYAFRLSPSNPWKIRRNNAFFNATKKELSIRRQIEFKKNLLDRYELLATYFYEQKRYQLINEQQSFATNRASIFQENMESDLFDARDFAEAKLDQIDGLEALDEALVEWNQTQRHIAQIFGASDFNWNSFEMISVATIDSISSSIANSSLSSIELDLITQRIEVARQEVRLEKADFDIGYIQAEYFPFTNRDTEIGYSVGVTIPIFQKNRPQIAERKLDEIELKSELYNEQYQDSVKRILEYEHLKNLVNHHKHIVTQINEIDLSNLVNNLARIEDYDPISILDLKEGILKLDQVLLKSQQRVMEQYLKFLFTFDAFIQQPLVNYLSNNLEKIE